MDTRLRYQETIKSILQEHANYRAAIPDGYIPKFSLMMNEEAT